MTVRGKGEGGIGFSAYRGPSINQILRWECIDCVSLYLHSTKSDSSVGSSLTSQDTLSSRMPVGICLSGSS